MKTNVNFGTVSDDYSKYRDSIPNVIFDEIRERGITFKDLNVVDIGSGTGIFSRELASEGARVIGIEPSIEMIKKAIDIDTSLGLTSINYVHSKAEEFELSKAYPIFTVVRAWHWFDRLKVIKNIKKHLEINGIVIIINSIFSPESDIAKITFEVLQNNNISTKPAGSYAEVKERRTGFPVNWFEEWEDNSLTILDEWEHFYSLQFSHEEWCGKISSVSWMTNVEEDIKEKVKLELTQRLSGYDQVLTIQHKYSVVILKNSE